MKKDNRILYDFDVCKYTVSDINNIYHECSKEMKKYDLNNLEFLYDFFRIEKKSRFPYSRADVTEKLSEEIAIILVSSSVENVKKEIRKCRRKFYYWEDLPAHIYFINEQLDNHNSNKRLKEGILIDKSFYDYCIACACYLLIIEFEDFNVEKIEDDKLWLHKLDFQYTISLKYFSEKYKISENLEICLDEIFCDIYNELNSFEQESVYEFVYKELYKCFGNIEKRIRINNEENSALPTLWLYSIKALSECNQRDETGVYKEINPINSNTFNKIIQDIQNAIILLDVNNEHDIQFIFNSDINIYLKHIMNYSSVYDIHQYVPEGMLFLIKRIISKYGKKIQEYYQCDSNNFFDIISKFVRKAQCDFEKGKICKIPFNSIDSIENKILESMSSKSQINKGYNNPIQWNKVYSDSEWVIKTNDGFYIIPPIISMFGVYDKIAESLNWIDFGAQIEEAVLDLFRGIKDLKVYDGKYIFKEKVYECDAIIVGKEYALIIESKRKGLSRLAREGTCEEIIKDISDTYFSSQSQAYRMQRAIESFGKKIDIYPSSCKIDINEQKNRKFNEKKQIVDCSAVKHFVRISCTGGSFWITSESMITDNIERNIDKYKSKTKHIEKFIMERDKLLTLKDDEHEKRVINLDKLFLSFDKLYEIVNTLSMEKIGDDLLKGIWQLTRIKSKKCDTVNCLSALMDIIN